LQAKAEAELQRAAAQKNQDPIVAFRKLKPLLGAGDSDMELIGTAVQSLDDLRPIMSKINACMAAAQKMPTIIHSLKVPQHDGLPAVKPAVEKHRGVLVDYCEELREFMRTGQDPAHFRTQVDPFNLSALNKAAAEVHRDLMAAQDKAEASK
jgi:hypothetical protein